MSKLELGESEVLKNLLEEKELLEKQNKILKEALEFYADTETYNVDYGDVAYDDDFECFTIDADENTGSFPGKRARQALEKCEEMQ